MAIKTGDGILKRSVAIAGHRTSISLGTSVLGGLAADC